MPQSTARCVCLGTREFLSTHAANDKGENHKEVYTHCSSSQLQRLCVKGATGSFQNTDTTASAESCGLGQWIMARLAALQEIVGGRGGIACMHESHPSYGLVVQKIVETRRRHAGNRPGRQSPCSVK